MNWLSTRLKAIGVAAVIAAVALMLLASCGLTRISPGHVGVVVRLAGDQRGVADIPTATGWVWYNRFRTEVFEYPTFVQTVVWTKDVNEGHPLNEEITFTTKDNMAVSVDISLAYSIRPEKVPSFYVKFRSDDLSHFTHGFLRNITRDMMNETAGRYGVDQIMGDNEEFIRTTRARLEKELEPVGVHIEQFGFTGVPRPPQPIVDAINAKVRATQDAIRMENELRQAQAEAAKAVAAAEGQAKARVVHAEGEARANEVLAKSLSPALLQWREMDLRERAVARWNGSVPQYSNGSTPIPFIQVK